MFSSALLNNNLFALTLNFEFVCLLLVFKKQFSECIAYLVRDYYDAMNMKEPLRSIKLLSPLFHGGHSSFYSLRRHSARSATGGRV